MEKSSLIEFLDKLVPELELNIDSDTRSTIRSISPLLYDYKFQEKKFNKWGDSNLEVMINFFNNIFFTHENHYNFQIENSDNRPYWQYKTIIDARSNGLDQQLNDLVYKYDSKFWDQFYPPNYLECRGYIRALSDKQINEMGLRIYTNIPIHPYPDFSINFNKIDFRERFKSLCIKLLS